MLDLNVTKSLLEAVFNSLELSKELTQILADEENAPIGPSDGSIKRAEAKSKGKHMKTSTLDEKRLTFNPFVIRNLTHYHIKYWSSAVNSAKPTDPSASAAAIPVNPFAVAANARSLKPGDEEPLNIVVNREDIKGDEEDVVRV